MKKITRTIAELPAALAKPWMCRETGVRYKSANGALAAIKREGARMAKTGTPSSIQVLWATTTDIGARIVRGIQ